MAIQAGILEGALHAADFRRPRQKAQDVAVMFAQGRAHHLCHLLFEVDFRAARHVAGSSTSKLRPRAATMGSVAQQLGDGLQIQGRRHHHDAQILAQVLLALEAQREPQVGVQAALVKFVEDHAADARESRVVLQHARENALGDHLDARLAAHPRFEPGAKPDAAADGFAEQMRHAAGDGARRQAARFEHQDLLAAQPGTWAQEERHDGAFTGAWRSLQQHIAANCVRASASAGRASLIGKSGRGGGLTSSLR